MVARIAETEVVFASITEELKLETPPSVVRAMAQALGTQGIERGSVAHCEATSEVMSEVSADYFPGLRFV
jgi:hypothetical protein